MSTSSMSLGHDSMTREGPQKHQMDQMYTNVWFRAGFIYTYSNYCTISVKYYLNKIYLSSLCQQVLKLYIIIWQYNVTFASLCTYVAKCETVMCKVFLASTYIHGMRTVRSQKL
jgi:hypothetical protein